MVLKNLLKIQKKNHFIGSNRNKESIEAGLKIVGMSNIFPSEKIPVILKREKLLHLEFMKWGLIPKWSQTRTPFFNARVESIKEKPSFRKAINKRRCLIPANGFYEWTQEKSKNQPYFICLKNNICIFYL